MSQVSKARPATSQPDRKQLLIKSVALPSEHGGWGFLLEPILLGLLVAFSWQGILLAVAAFGVFLIHQPLKIIAKDRHKANRPPRLAYAERFAMGYGLLAVIPMLILLFTTPLNFLVPVALAVPFALVQLYYDSRNQSRALIPEVCGALALAMIAPAIAMLAGWNAFSAMWLWVLLAIRAISVIFYVRSRVRLRIGKPDHKEIAWLLHGVSMLMVMGLSWRNVVPMLAIVPFVVLFIRALVGLSRYRKNLSMKAIGFRELAYGIMTVTLIAAGYILYI